MAGQRVTIYTTSGFMGNVVAIRARLVEHGRRRYAQYSAAPFVTFIPKGKRRPRTLQTGYRPYIVVVDGWNAPEPASMCGPERLSSTGCLVSKSRYLSHDDRWKSDFDAVLENSKVDIVADYRDQMPPPKGIRWVFLNGQPVLREGKLTKTRAGRVLRAYGNRYP